MADRADAMPVRVLRYGVDEPLPARRTLRAGPLTAVLEGGDLRYVRVAGVEVVRRLYVAVRDRNWGTVPPRYEEFRVEEDGRDFVVRFRAVHREGDVDFAWEGRILGTAAGVIACSMAGEVRQTCLRNRIGFCVLHPMELAGTPVETETPDGPVAGTFPDLISPDQPFFDMTAISHPVPGLDARVTIRFAGDLFEMEDQRNWTDASYKTYGTPLRLPFPVRVEAGTRVEQTVTLTVGATDPLPLDGYDETLLAVRVGAESVGTLPPIGLGAASHGRPLDEGQLALLRTLRLGHLRAEVDLTAGGWRDRLTAAAGDATALGVPLEIEALSGDGGEGLDELAAALAEEGMPPTARLLAFPATGMTTTEAVAGAAERAVAGAGLETVVGGGSRAYFTELNRAELPLDRLRAVGYTLNPQVHAFDNASLVETLAAQAETVRSARAIVGDRHLAVGPVTFRPRFNPNATGPEPEPAGDDLPPEVDPRQLSLFAAGWTVGSLRHLAGAGADSLTYFETIGWRGVVERKGGLTHRDRFPSAPGQPYPLSHVLAAVGEHAGGEVLAVEVSDGLSVEALALRSGVRVTVLVASFGDEEREVELRLPPLAGRTLRRLDEADGGRGWQEDEGGGRGDTVAVRLRPFGLARVDGRLGG